MTDEIGCLIERTVWPRTTPEYLCIVGQFDGVYGFGKLQWVDRHQDALRFGRREDAAKFIGMIRLLSDDLPYIKTIPGLRSADPFPTVCEHMWSEHHVEGKARATGET